MRIRTVKPAFWANEKMAALPDFARLLALGLLNYADDFGYFWANPLMIRGALFPFDEDSSKVRKALAQLAVEGYLRIGKTPDGREAGHIINFTKHQRVDRPAASEIQPLVSFDDDSANVLRLFDDESSLDRKGMEGIGRDRKGSTPRPPAAEIEERIYEAYPRKVGKQDALKAIRKALDGNPALADRMLGLVEAYSFAVSKWPEDAKQFVPHPATWFNRGSYEDDPATWQRRETAVPGVGKPSAFA